jgi:hypothetical protein
MHLKKPFSIHRIFSTVGFLLGLVVFLFSTTAVHADTSGVWTFTGSMAGTRQGGSATLLHNGTVLVVGGGEISSTTGQYDSKATELYDPTTGTWSSGGETLTDTNIFDRTAILLPNGKVVVGTNLYDPDTNSWSDAGDIPEGLVLPNGKILALGWATSTLYDPNTGTSTTLNNTGDVSFVSNWSGAPDQRTLTVLSDGRVLLAGGQYCYPYNGTCSSFETNYAAVYDPNTATWSRTGDMLYAIREGNGYHSTTTLLPNGKVLYAGGYGCFTGYNPSTLDCSVTNYIAQAELYDPTTGTWSATGSLNYPRYNHTAILLPNGKVLVAGGAECSGTYNPSNGSCSGGSGSTFTTAEIYDPNTGTWSTTGNLNSARDYTPATLLQNGKVLIAGGDSNSTAELFDLAPSVGTITVSTNPVQINNSVTASANFTDIDTTDTHTAVWNWGDGNTTTGTLTESNGSGSVSDSHTYTSAGVYPITLTVTDNSGGSGTQTFQYISVYNPTAQGLFSAGQKYTSPAGAYAANTSLTGNVLFGLSYKYQGTMPTGVRQFSMDFNQANFHFNATSVNALVISNGIGTLTGTGTVNGSGTYTFLVTGSESADTIRIQIKDSSGNVVYDTQPGAADTATPTTSVTGNVLAH